MGVLHRVCLPHIAVLLTLTIVGIPLAAAQPDPALHVSRFEMTEPFIRYQWRHPVRSLDVVPQGAGPVHIPPGDCEIHVGAALVDQSISNFVGLVLEPPNQQKVSILGKQFADVGTVDTYRSVGIGSSHQAADTGKGNCRSPTHPETCLIIILRVLRSRWN